jgi:hypothetical protein
MPSPFPGMDPYVEEASVWSQLRTLLVSEIVRQLNDWLPEPFVAKSTVRATGGRSTLTRAPAPPTLCSVTTRGRERSHAAGDEPWVVPFPGDQRDDRLVLIADTREPGRVVTVLEVLGVDHKTERGARDRYAKTQLEVLESDANLVEIDLLLCGERVLPSFFLENFIAELQPTPDYIVLVSRAWRRVGSGLGYRGYSWTLRERLPTVMIPLRSETDEVPLDLQSAWNTAYDQLVARGGIDYESLPMPRLSADDALWAEELRQLATLRGGLDGDAGADSGD